jgi:cardiolipin synthase
MRSAERSIWLSASYFVPTREIMDTLKNAAGRGIDVRLMLPDHSDSAPAIAVARSRYGELLEAGVKIFEMHGIFLHSKTVVIDNVWSAIGSSNIDPRSVLYNDEVDAVVLGVRTADAVRVTLERDLLDSTPIDLATWEDRPFTKRIGEFFAGIVESLL